MALEGEKGRRQRDVEKEALAGECVAVSRPLHCLHLEKGRWSGKGVRM